VPQVVFTEPAGRSVGLTAAQAQKEGARGAGRRFDLANIAGASTRAAHYRGQARAVVDTDRDVLVGATFVGADTAELLQAATIAIVGEVPLAGCGTPCRPTPPSARCGCGGSRRSGARVSAADRLEPSVQPASAARNVSTTGSSGGR
jgi:pyruvate/2-oxoglutarate dehydrogenase complex dihydrolipoamide dehydrogenase (E3) component